MLVGKLIWILIIVGIIRRILGVEMIIGIYFTKKRLKLQNKH
jgi:hypothetical protein